MGYPMCNSHLKTRKENSYAKANFKFYLMCGADMRTFPTTATAMGSQAEYTGVCTHGSHEGYIELTSEYLATHNDRLSSGKYYLSGDLNYSGSYYLDVAPNANVELCLNGHTLTFSNQYLWFWMMPAFCLKTER